MPREKTTVRKLDGKWTITRPRYGFGNPEQTVHQTHVEAIGRAFDWRPSTAHSAVLDRNTSWDFDQATRVT